MMAAITPTDKPYMKTSVFETYAKRIPWLLILMISATFTGWIITSFLRSEKRHALQEHLKKWGINTLVHYPVPPHKQKAYEIGRASCRERV